MFRLIPLSAVSLLFLSGAVDSRADASRNAEQLASFGALAFSDVMSVWVARIVDLKAHDRTSSTDLDFHGCSFASRWRMVGPQDEAGLAELLRGNIDFFVRAYRAAGNGYVDTNGSFCAPDYGYAIRLYTADGVRDFLICLRCGQIEAFGNEHTVAFGLHGSDLAKLKAYYLGEFIPSTGDNRQIQPPKN